MRSVEEHAREVLKGVVPLEPIILPLLEAHGCVLAEDVTAQWPLPSFDNTSMDGYAVQSADLTTASSQARVSLKVVDDVPAGYRATEQVTPGTAIRIMTGAPLPDGADAVVPVEWTDAGIHNVSILRPVDQGAHIRRAGEDVLAGQVVLRAGTQLTSRSIALVAAVGRAEVWVHPRPRVVVISTGNELVDPGVPLRHGLIADSNGIMLVTAAQEAGAEAFRAGPVPDDEQLLMATLDDQLVRADLVITSGGVSMGAYDTVKAVLARLGTVDFLKVAMQPGMPQGHGHIGPDATPIITLPGNPVSSYVSFEMFVRPVIRRMMGFQHVHRRTVTAVCLTDMDSPAGKTQLARVRLRVEDGRYVAQPEGAQGSHIMGGLAHSDALAVIPPDVTHVSAGDAITVLDLMSEEDA